jgi:hypothetical protein
VAIESFEDEFGHYSIDDQRTALARILPQWIEDHNKSITVRVVVLVAVVLFFRSYMRVALASLIVVSVVRRILAMRAGLKTIRSKWGDSVIEQAGPLPYLLR